MAPFLINGVLSWTGKRVLVLQNLRGEWELPGVMPFPGEIPADALARQFVSALGMDVHVGRFLGTHIASTGPRNKVRVVTFECELSGPCQIDLSERYLEYDAFCESTLPDLAYGCRARTLQFLRESSWRLQSSA